MISHMVLAGMCVLPFSALALGTREQAAQEQQLKVGFFVWSGWGNPVGIFEFHQQALKNDGIEAAYEFMPQGDADTLHRMFKQFHVVVITRRRPMTSSRR